MRYNEVSAVLQRASCRSVLLSELTSSRQVWKQHCGRFIHPVSVETEGGLLLMSLFSCPCTDDDAPRSYSGPATRQLMPETFRERVYINKIEMQLEIDSSSLQSLESTLGIQLLLGYQDFLSNCMASSYRHAFKADRSRRAQLLMEHSYPFSHYCLLYVRFTRPEDNHQGLMCVCIAWPITGKGLVLGNTCPILWTDMRVQTRDFLPVVLHVITDVNTKSLRKLKFAPTCSVQFLH